MIGRPGYHRFASIAGRPFLNEAWRKGGGCHREPPKRVVILSLPLASTARPHGIGRVFLTSVHQTVRAKLNQVPQCTQFSVQPGQVRPERGEVL